MDTELAANASQWVSDSNSAVFIRLISGDTVQGVLEALRDDLTTESDEPGADAIEFHPAFTYPIYGEQERVFGYKGLRISLYYSTSSLATFFRVTYQKRVDNATNLKPDDVESPMLGVLSRDALCSSPHAFAQKVVDDSRSFRPLGKKVHEYRKGDTAYEVYSSGFVDAASGHVDSAFVEYHRRLQTFVVMYIEGAQFIDSADPRWRVYTVYERTEFNGVSSYSVVGYCSMYRFYHWPAMWRARISQFLVLPPFQGRGHGSALYSYLYHMVRRDPEYCDLTVEDPSEAFDDMRDLCDLRYLISEGVEVIEPLSREELLECQRKYKISTRQIRRCAEILLLKSIDKSKDLERYARFRLFVKRRIYAQNSDVLMTLEAEERKTKVAESFDAVEDDYHRIISLI